MEFTSNVPLKQKKVRYGSPDLTVVLLTTKYLLDFYYNYIFVTTSITVTDDVTSTISAPASAVSITATVTFN